MNRRLYCWVVLGSLAAMLPGCEWSDIGAANDMTSRQQQMREQRAIPDATQMPPGLGEDLPTPATQPMTSNQ